MMKKTTENVPKEGQNNKCLMKTIAVSPEISNRKTENDEAKNEDQFFKGLISLQLKQHFKSTRQCSLLRLRIQHLILLSLHLKWPEGDLKNIYKAEMGIIKLNQILATAHIF